MWSGHSGKNGDVHLAKCRVPDDLAASIGYHFVPPLSPVGVVEGVEDDDDLTSVEYSPDCCSDDLGLDPLDLCAVSSPDDSELKDVRSSEAKGAGSSAREAAGSLLVASS